jgi:nitrate reductase NapE component
MESSAAVKDRIWQESQIAETSRKSLERRALIKNFLVVAALIVLSLAAVGLLGNIGPGPAAL